MNYTLLLFFCWLGFITNSIALVIFSITTMRKKILIERLAEKIKNHRPGTTFGSILASEQNLHNDVRVAAMVASIFFAVGAMISATAIVYMQHH